jgi:YD repeat-containing protein
MTSSTTPEAGTVTYQYDGNHHVTQRTDAKGQQTQYSYDAYERLIETRHYTPTGIGGSLQEAMNQRVDYTYDANPLNPAANAWGRLGAVSFGVGSAATFATNFAYFYSYNQAGRVTGNQFIAADSGGDQLANLQATYAWDSQGRMTNMNYPSGAAMTYQYDNMSRLTGMTENGSAFLRPPIPRRAN